MYVTASIELNGELNVELDIEKLCTLKCLSDFYTVYSSHQ